MHVIHPLQLLVRPIIPSTRLPYSISSSRLHYLGDLSANCFLHLRMRGEQPEEPCQCSRRRVSARQHKTYNDVSHKLFFTQSLHVLRLLAQIVRIGESHEPGQQVVLGTQTPAIHAHFFPSTTNNILRKFMHHSNCFRQPLLGPDIQHTLHFPHQRDWIRGPLCA
eukprot:Gb_16939 [translate_table: standard]